MRLTAALGLTVDLDPTGAIRLGFDDGDWLGPGPLVLAEPVPTDGDTSGAAEAVEHVDDLGTADSVVVLDGAVRCSVRAYRDQPLVVFRAEATVA